MFVEMSPRSAKMSDEEMRYLGENLTQFKRDMIKAGFNLGKPKINEYQGSINIITEIPGRDSGDDRHVYAEIDFYTHFDPDSINLDILRDKSICKLMVPRELGQAVISRACLTEGTKILEGIENWAKEHGNFLVNFKNYQYDIEGMDIYALNKK